MPLLPSAHLLTYEFSVNNIVAQAGTAALTCADLLVALKSLLTGLASTPCTVAGTSDGVTAGMDAVDRIVDNTDIVRGGGAHSWMVLTWPALGVHLCIDCNTTNWWEATVVCSMAGFTGGSTTARPTATDQQVLVSSAAWGGSTGNSRQIVHIVHSQDGQLTHVIVIAGNVVRGHWIIGEAVNAIDDWTTPQFVAFWCDSGGASHGGRYNQIYANGATMRGWQGASTMGLSGSVTCSGASTIQPVVTAMTTVDRISGGWNFSPVGLYGTTTGLRGRHGRIPDFYVCSASVPLGSRFPSEDASGIWLSLADNVFPWNGSEPVSS